MDKPKSILIIEEELSLQHTLDHILKREGYRVNTSMPSLAALAFIKKEPVDLVVIGLSLLNDYGLAIFFRIKRQYPFLPVILLSSSPDYETIPCLYEEVAWTKISMPFEPKSILNIIQEMTKAPLKAPLELGLAGV